MTYTYTMALLEVSQDAYDEIRKKLSDGGYGHQIGTDSYLGKERINMHGLALVGDGKPNNVLVIEQNLDPGVVDRIKEFLESKGKTPIVAEGLDVAKAMAWIGEEIEKIDDDEDSDRFDVGAKWALKKVRGLLNGEADEDNATG